MLRIPKAFVNGTQEARIYPVGSNGSSGAVFDALNLYLGVNSGGDQTLGLNKADFLNSTIYPVGSGITPLQNGYGITQDTTHIYATVCNVSYPANCGVMRVDKSDYGIAGVPFTFTDDFELGNLFRWSQVTGSPTVTSAAAMNGTTLGMSIPLTAPNHINYVTDATPNNEIFYKASFYFNPNRSNTKGGAQTIFEGLDSSNQSIFKIQFRKTISLQYQIRMFILTSLGWKASNWYAVVPANGNYALPINFKWSSGTSAVMEMRAMSYYGERIFTFSADTSAYKLGSVRLGSTEGNQLMSGTQYFDQFTSTNIP